MKNRNFQKPRFLKTVSFLRPNFSEKPYIPKTMVGTSYFLIRIFPKTVISQSRNFRKPQLQKSRFLKTVFFPKTVFFSLRPNFSEKPQFPKNRVFKKSVFFPKTVFF